MNRRTLLRRLGAAVVAAPVLVVAATRPAEAEGEEASAQAYQRGYDVATARAESRLSQQVLMSYEEFSRRAMADMAETDAELAEVERLLTVWRQSPEGIAYLAEQVRECERDA